MATCKECIHNNVCCYTHTSNSEPCGGWFEDKNLYIKLPCKVGNMCYCISTPCGGCECFNEPMREEFIETCRKCSKTEVIECKFDYDLIGEFGKTVFRTREEAEAKLKELSE